MLSGKNIIERGKNMDEYNKQQNNYNGQNGYYVDPNNNSYRYTGATESTGAYSDTSQQRTADNRYSTYSSYSSYSSAAAEREKNAQNQDRYYSPYERRMSDGEEKKAKRQKREKRAHGFGMTLVKTACIAGVFGLVAGAVFGGVNYFLPGEVEISALSEPEAPAENALTTTKNEDVQKNTAMNGQIVLTDVSDIVEACMPSIVAITNMTETEYRTWFGQTYSQENDYAGSGIIVSEDEDYLYIATNNHVVEGAKTLTVQFCDSNTVAAEVKGTNAATDLAVVKVAKEDIEEETKAAIRIAKINDNGNEEVGEPVIAIGNALGYGQSVTSGIISALEREVTAQDSTTGETYANSLTQTDASINPGNSGGALLNAEGEVIGINSSKMGGDYVDGVGFAIPMTTAAPIINELITREKVTEEKAGYLGVNGIDVDESVSNTYNMPSGIYVAKVYEGSAAAEAGIQQGDIIVGFAGHDVKSMQELQELLQYHAAGSEVTVTICRADDGQYVEKELDMILGSKN